MVGIILVFPKPYCILEIVDILFHIIYGAQKHTYLPMIKMYNVDGLTIAKILKHDIYI